MSSKSDWNTRDASADWKKDIGKDGDMNLSRILNGPRQAAETDFPVFTLDFKEAVRREAVPATIMAMMIENSSDYVDNSRLNDFITMGLAHATETNDEAMLTKILTKVTWDIGQRRAHDVMMFAVNQDNYKFAQRISDWRKSVTAFQPAIAPTIS